MSAGFDIAMCTQIFGAMIGPLTIVASLIIL